jgi:hypothetical protein
MVPHSRRCLPRQYSSRDADLNEVALPSAPATDASRVVIFRPVVCSSKSCLDRSSALFAFSATDAFSSSYNSNPIALRRRGSALRHEVYLAGALPLLSKTYED